jgi:hypothetical protein
VEELLSQLPEDVIGSGLNKEDLGRVPPPSPLQYIYSQGVSLGASSEEL